MIINSFSDPHFTEIADNIKSIREEIENSAVASGRTSKDIRLMAVTKTVSVDYINYAIDNCGITLIGENKVQEYLSKKDLLHLDGVEKHLIGHLQTNKVKKIVPEVDMIQSVDSVRVAEEISKEAIKLEKVFNILLEVNIGEENSKTGFDKGEFFNSLDVISNLDNICVKGLMTIPPICDNDLQLERYFDSMNDYYNEIKERKYGNFDFNILSMGMSGDFALAVKHGSNLVRVGSKIFGARIYK
ncbi:MAG: YggS family pyridoxal phosphate-dependent enzyme [Acutalibacteraceae bacterium]